MDEKKPHYICLKYPTDHELHGKPDPSKKMASDYIAAYEKLNGAKPATFGANVFDAGLLLQKAIPIAAG